MKFTIGKEVRKVIRFNFKDNLSKIELETRQEADLNKKRIHVKI